MAYAAFDVLLFCLCALIANSFMVTGHSELFSVSEF